MSAEKKGRPTAAEVGRWLEGTTKDQSDVQEHFNLTEREAEGLVIASGVERCEGCDWNFRKADLGDTPTGYICPECKKERVSA